MLSLKNFLFKDFLKLSLVAIKVNAIHIYNLESELRA